MLTLILEDAAAKAAAGNEATGQPEDRQGGGNGGGIRGGNRGGNGVTHHRGGGRGNINLKVGIEYRLSNAWNLTLNCIKFVGEYWAVVVIPT